MQHERERLVASLIVEAFQAERSGAEHPAKEAKRLGETPPGRAMSDIAADCQLALDELRAIALRPDLPQPGLGEKVGGAFSLLRDRVGDLLVTREMSYRGTLLGVHHCVDVITLLRAAAETAGDVEVVEWCMRTLDRRTPLLEAAQRELTWFGRNPERAVEPAKRSIMARSARVVVGGLGTALGLRGRS